MLRALWVAIAALLPFALTGCTRSPFDERILTSAEAVVARAALDDLARVDLPAVVERLDPSQRTSDHLATLRQLASLFPAGAPGRIRIVAFNKNAVRVIGDSTTEITEVLFESNYADANLLSRVVVRRVDRGSANVMGLHVQPLAAPLAVLNAFTLSGKGPVHYGFLVIAVGVAVATVVALVTWFRRRMSIRHRWPWLVAIVLGVSTVTLNWTTGAVAFKLAMVQLFGVGAMRPSVDGPWLVAISIPVGAIAFLIHGRRSTAAPGLRGASDGPF